MADLNPKPPISTSGMLTPEEAARKSAAFHAAPVVPVLAAPPPEPPDLPAGLSRYRVTLGEVSSVVVARDPNEAWAMFCDGRKSWPGPKASGRVVEAL